MELSLAPGAPNGWEGTVASVFLSLAPIWLFGIVTGYMLPRPRSFNLSYLLLSGTGLRNALLACQGALIVRDAWYWCTEPRTFRNFCKAVLVFFCTGRWTFDFPAADRPSEPTACDHSAVAVEDTWYINEKDLAFFRYHAEGSGAMQGAGPWEVMMDKEIPGTLKYTAWRRVLPNGKTEYKSSTICPDATSEEFIDLYFDDDFRPNWDTMIIAHSVAEHGDFSSRQQVVRWTRRFPFSFISDRQYTIARRLFRHGSNLYGITKAVDHPAAREDTEVVSVDEFYSMWRSRTVDCPWGSGRPAVETLLLHHEQFKIPENLARFAVRHGMWSFVKKLTQVMPDFIAQRRAKGVAPEQLDPTAFGAGCAPNPPQPQGLARSDTCSSSVFSDSSSAGCSDNSSECDLPQQRGGRRRGGGSSSGGASVGRKLRGFAAFAIASSLAVLVRRGSSGLSGPGAKHDKHHHHHNHRDMSTRLGRSASLESALGGRQGYRFAADPFTE